MPVLYAFFVGSFLTVAYMLQFFTSPAYPMWLWGLCTLWLLLCILTGKKGQNTQKIAVVGVGIMGAMVCVQFAVQEIGPAHIQAYANTHVLLEGTVHGQPDDRKLKVQYTVTNLRLIHSGATSPLQGKILLVDRQMWQRYQPGDRIEFEGKVEIPTDDEEFSYKNYLSIYGIAAIMNSYKIADKGVEHTAYLQRTLWQWKEVVERTINTVFPEPGSSLLAGLLTGTRAGMPDEVTHHFQVTGLTHIVAISGFNITLIISILGSCLFFLPRRWRLYPTIISIILFTLFVGAGASVVRASITGILGLYALHLGRLHQARLAVAWTALFMTCWNPYQLWYDLGFQLSFLAVIGLMEVAPVLKPLFSKVPTALGIQEALLATLSAQLTAVPLSLYHFGNLSLIAPVANILVAPLIPLSMLFGALGTGVGFFSPFLGKIVGLPGVLFLETTIAIAHICAQLPLSSVQNIQLPLPIFILYYGLLVLIVISIRKRTSPPI